MSLENDVTEALQLVAQYCPRIVKSCYWSGSSPIILEETQHRQSYDIDLHTFRALRDVRPLQAQLQQGLGSAYQTLSAADSLGSGFRGSLTLSSGATIIIELLSSFESPLKSDLVISKLVPAWKRVGLRRYTLDKLQCVVERSESRDLVDLQVMFDYRPYLAELVAQSVSQLDVILLSERLLLWSDAALEKDLLAYPGVDYKLAVQARNQLLAWVRR